MLVARYGGSYRSAASFTSRSPRLPGNVNINTALDLGSLPFGSYVQSGSCGRTTGAATLFWRFRTTEPARIGLQLTPINKHTDDDTDINLTRVDGRQGLYSGERWFYQRPSGSIREGDSAGLIDPGEFVITVSANSFHALPFSWFLEIRPSITPEPDFSVQLLTRARLNQTRTSFPVALPLSVSSRLLTDHKLGTSLQLGYVLAGYWEDGYSVTIAFGPGRVVGPRMDLSVKASLQVITPTTL